MTKKTTVLVLLGVTVALVLGWWFWSAYQQRATAERLHERLRELVTQQDWQVRAVRTDGGFVTRYAFIVHQGAVVRSSDETPGRTGAPHYIIKNNTFYSLVSDYQDFKSGTTIPRAYIEANLETAAEKPALVRALAALQESFPLYYVLLHFEDREAFLKSVSRVDPAVLDRQWVQISETRYALESGDPLSSHLPRAIEFVANDPEKPILRLEYFNETGYAGPGPTVELEFTPVDDLAAALRFPADYVRVETW